MQFLWARGKKLKCNFEMSRDQISADLEYLKYVFLLKAGKL